VPAEFVKLADDIRVIVNLLNDYLRDGGVDVPGSRAEAEHAQEGNFADEQVADPVVHIQVRAHHNLVAAIDHLGGVAACMEAENVALATISLLRPIVVAAGINYHVLDPSITLRERLRRGWNLELESVREQLNGVDKNDLPTGWQDLAHTRHRYLTWADAHGYERRKRDQRYGQRRYWLADGEQDSPPPSEIKLAEAVLSALGDGKIGKTVYQFTSSFIHTQSHAFTMFLPALDQYDEQTPYAVPLGISIQDMTTWVMVATLALHTAAARCMAYFGWDPADWVRIVHPVMSRWTATIGPG
jgi:hypothetical protein